MRQNEGRTKMIRCLILFAVALQAWTGLSLVNSAAQASPSSSLVDYIIDSVAALVPKGARFFSQIGAEVFKKTDVVDNSKKGLDSYVKP